MCFLRVLLVLWLIAPFAAGAATSTLTLPAEPTTEGEEVLINWQPVAGIYRVTAERIDENGSVTGSETAMFTVKALPPPAPPEVQGTSTTVVESSTKIQETIASIVPQASVAAPVFGAIDNLRQKGADVLDRGAEWAKGKAAKPEGEVAGESAESTGVAGTALQLVATLLIYLFAILTFLVSNAGVFYPLLAIVFFYILWRTFKRMRRPKYH